MYNLYESNGLVFWNEDEIRLRRMFEEHFVRAIYNNLKTQNSGFEMVQVEAPLITPYSLINKGYTEEDLFVLSSDRVLRPETTMGSYKVLEHLLNTHHERKYRLPLVVWQHGKSFRREQDQPTKFMRLKEFYQLEFQIAYSASTQNDYSIKLIPAVCHAMESLLGVCTTQPSDRLPDYSESTTDIIAYIRHDEEEEESDKVHEMEVCSISKRNDFPNAKVLEVAIGTDRCIHAFQKKIVE